jgi:hypothetical protein
MSHARFLQSLTEDRIKGLADSGDVTAMGKDGVPLRRDAYSAPVRGHTGEVAEFYAADLFDIARVVRGIPPAYARNEHGPEALDARRFQFGQ